MFPFFIEVRTKKKYFALHVNSLCFIGKDETKPEIRYNEKGVTIIYKRWLFIEKVLVVDDEKPISDIVN